MVARFRVALAKLPIGAGDRAVAAVSGGADSIALLDLLQQTRASHHLDLTVGHVDHGIHDASASVAARVAETASALGLPHQERRLSLGAGTSETDARTARYAALHDIRRAAGARWIITAHHADDQAETVLMRLLRGSGPAGLAGMAPVRRRLLRPLLSFGRAELAAYAAARGLSAWDDPANSDRRHLRAWVRHDVMPVLQARLPDMIQRIVGTAAEAAEARLAWDAALDALDALSPERELGGISVAAPPLAGYDSGLGAALIRAAARRAGIVVGSRRAALVLELARTGRSGSSLPLGGGARAEIAFGRLRLIRTVCSGEHGAPLAFGSTTAGELRWGRWSLRWAPELAPGEQPRNGMTAWFVPLSELQVRRWVAGDRIRPLGGVGRRLVVRCFQDARVPRARRADWPIIESAGQVVWAPGVCRGAALVPEAGSEALRVDAAYA